jgi:starch phosphorylase
MKPIKTYHVAPALPGNLQRLRDLAFNLYWCWHPDVIEVFRRLDRDLWESTGHNPVKMLGEVRQGLLNTLSTDEGFLAQLRRASDSFETYLGEHSYVGRACAENHVRVGYFSMEFGLTECLSIYSGGLGMLAGDHLKSASDLGVDLVAVGLLYQQGYARQYLNADGWQQEAYPENDFYNLPVTECRGADEQPVYVSVDLPTGPVWAKVWRCDVGRVPLILLDTNHDRNARVADRDITDRLYGGDDDMRVRQEILLGIGGLRALEALGQRPTVCHMNEGHAAFLALERVRLYMAEHGAGFAEAVEATSPGNVFTTHTPVPAGNDRFAPAVMETYFQAYYPQLGLGAKDFLALGRENPSDDQEYFCMTVLALKLAAHNNAVSELHGEVARAMWRNVYQNVPLDEVPIGHITNGVHARSWVSGDMAELFDRYMGPRWADNPMDRAVWERVEQIPDEELWRTHERRRERLVAYARQCLRRQLERVGGSPRELRTAAEILDPKALTIGFARRFATYKRATLLLRDPQRLSAILNQAGRPVQVLYAGKAHPADNHGKEFIRELVHTARSEQFRHRLVFIEDYDQDVARRLVQGVDVWLNTPLRPMEASGTSGMKVVFNGGLNCSIPDGWWPEGYNGLNGWCIGRGEEYADQAYQDDVESSALYDLLERDIVPLFYDREGDGPPRDWVSRIKNSIRTLAPVFNTNRMVLEYTRRFYLPSGLKFHQLNSEGRATALAGWKARIRAGWAGVKIVAVNGGEDDGLTVGDKKPVSATVALGALTVGDVAVEAYYGAVDARNEIVGGSVVTLAPGEPAADGSVVYSGAIGCAHSGRQGYQVRVVPRHPDLENPLTMGLVRWA